MSLQQKELPTSPKLDAENKTDVLKDCSINENEIKSEEMSDCVEEFEFQVRISETECQTLVLNSRSKNCFKREVIHFCEIYGLDRD